MPYVNTEARYENTTMREIQNDNGDLTGYDIAPVNGYVLHSATLDKYKHNPETFEQGELISHGYSPSSCSVMPDYDFDVNPDEIYAVKEDEIEENGVIY